MVHSIHSHTVVKQKCRVNILGSTSDFFILPHLQTFDAIIGLYLLNSINARIDLKSKVIQHDKGHEELKYSICEDVNFLNIEDILVPSNVRVHFNNVIKQCIKVFADPNESLPFNTNIIATICTTNNDSVYSKLYPYPMGVAEFVNKEIKDLLANNIIRPSRSLYNNPIWSVDKKGTDEAGNKKND